MSDHRKKLRIALINGLAATTCPLNSKLRAEDRLVDALGVSHNYLRAAMNDLADEGILLRRRPVGTFLVRRPEPIPQNLIPDDMPLNLQQILPELLIEEEKTKIKTPQPALLPELIKIQFWGNNPWDGPSQHLYQLGMMQTAMRMNIKLTFHALETEAGLLTHTQVREQMQTDPAAVYIVPVEWRENFSECFDSLPTLYMDAGSMMAPENTHVGLDSIDMVERALGAFVEGGMKRIAMAAITKERVDSDWYYQNLTRRYRNFMVAHHLDYGCITFIKLQLNEVVEATRVMLKDYCPEAIYVHGDFLLPGIALELKRQGLIPGRDIAIITMSNKGLPLAAGHDWTTLQNNLKELGEQALAQAVLYARGDITQMPSIWLKPSWKWGNTHTVNKMARSAVAALS